METVQLAHLDNFAQKIVDLLQQPLDLARGKSHATLLALQGDLGSGKTTFVQALAKALGITETLQSPTYVLMKSYDIPKSPNQNVEFEKLVHIDAYRLENPKQFAALLPAQAGMPSFLEDPKVLVCIEWPERVEGELPKPDLVINFSSEGMQEGERGVEIEK
jgi:tRNA threonylcarbamoyladenosine biosynthesis protein TsaE